MTQDEIIEMAKQANAGMLHGGGYSLFGTDAIERFAKLVAQHTLANIDPSKFISFQEGVEAGRLAEREACAIVCDDINAKYKWPDDVAERVASQWCADSIRARGQA